MPYGSDLIALWLTPMDLYNVKQAMPCKWDWGQSWYSGKVRDRAVASKTAVCVSIGKDVDTIIDMFR